MKKGAILLALSLLLSLITGCSKIDDRANVNTNNTQTIQIENPTETTTGLTTTLETTTEPTTVTTTEITTTSPPQTTTATKTTTQKVVTTKSPVITTQPPVTTTAKPPVVTTTAPVTTQPINPSNYTALNFNEQKAMWISYLEFINILKGKTESQFTASVKAMYDNCVSMGINTLYVHARARSDAYYNSNLFPWSSNCTGTIDVAPSFDPFKILVDEAHARGLSIHAWINPMRGLNDSEIKSISDKYLIKQWYNDPNKRGKYIVLLNGAWYLSPAYQEVRDLITNGAKEIISKYNVDGIHIDDYFYPTTDTSFDNDAFVQSGSTNRTQWRLDTVSSMVKGLYVGIKNVNPTVLFGVSPQGNINNNYSFQYADVKKWCSSPGYLDYIVPQLYYGFNNNTLPYNSALQMWCNIVTAPNVKLIVGLAPYKLGTTESNGEWLNDKRIMARQVESFRAQPKYSGVAFFRYESLFMPAASVANQVSQERAELAAILK